MGATIERDHSGIWVLRVSGALRKEELDAVQAEALKGMTPQERAKVLVMIDDHFSGWVGTEVWNDMTFFATHGEKIEKMAIVGDPKWESRMLMFTGAGFRKTAVKYFTQPNAKEARAWLL